MAQATEDVQVANQAREDQEAETRRVQVGPGSGAGGEMVGLRGRGLGTDTPRPSIPPPLQREASAAKQRVMDEYEGKVADLLSSLHRVERAFVKQRDAHDAALQKLRQEHVRVPAFSPAPCPPRAGTVRE